MLIASPSAPVGASKVSLGLPLPSDFRYSPDCHRSDVFDKSMPLDWLAAFATGLVLVRLRL